MHNVLWLCSWYPNKLDPFVGDFIQRHARATSLYANVHVIHVSEDKDHKLAQKLVEEKTNSTQLSEHLIYFQPIKNPNWLQRIYNNIQYSSLFRKAIREYIKKNGKPHCVHVHVPMKAGLQALWMRKKYKINFVVTEHWAIYNQIVADRFLQRSKQFRYGTKQILKKAKLFLPVSDDLGQSIQEQVIQVPYRVIRNVVDTKLFFYNPAKATTTFRFVHASTLNFQKNPEGLLDAIHQLAQMRTDFEVVFVGPHSRSVIEHSRALGLYNKHVFFKGEVSYAEVAFEMQQANALVLFSRFENLPCVIGEAFCCGLPVISTNVGGIAEIIAEQNGVLVNNEDVEALANAMKDMIRDYEFYDRKKIAEQATFAFNYSNIGRQINEVYNSI